tara:strand:+ start:327 stop:4079 length:3753 start_codon:yes stop_codon:yes gene_type:complete
MVKLNDYNKNKLGTSNGTSVFPQPFLLKDKIPDVFPANFSEAPVSDFSATEVANANLKDYFSYYHQHIGQGGLIRYTPAQGIEFTYGSGKYQYSPLKDSLGGFEVFEPGFPVVSARSYKKLQSVASQGKIYSQQVARVPLPSNYQSEGMTHIQFSDLAPTGNPIKKAPSDEILDGHVLRQYILLYGHLDPSFPGLTGESTFATAFEKFRLGFASLFFSLNQKRNSWNYFYPTAKTSDFGLPTFSNTKTLSFAGPTPAGQLSYDRTVNDVNNSFLSHAIASDSDAYHKEISAITYQLLVGGQDSSESSTVTSYDKLPPGIEDKMYSDFNYSLDIPISQEVVSYLDATVPGQEVSQETLIADVKPVYNFTITNYHQAMPLIPEIRIPNIYHVAQQGPENFLQGFYLALAVDDPSELISGAISNYKEIPFFEKLADQFINCDEDEQSVYGNPEYTKTMNIVWDPNSFTEQVEDLKEVFPMYVEVEFDPPSSGHLTDELLANLHGTGIIQEYIRTMLTFFNGPLAKIRATNITGEYKDEYYDDYLSKLVYLSDLGIIPEESPQSSVVTLNKKNSLTGKTDLNFINQNIFNFNKWFSTYGALAVHLDDHPDNMVGLINPSLYNNYTRFFVPGLDPNPLNAFVSSKDIYAKQVIGLQRTIDQILNGQKSASIPLYYVIEKRDQGGALIQNIIIPAQPSNQSNPGTWKKIKYIDTQVKYNKAYSYSIKAQTIVIGSDYTLNFEMNSETGKIATQVGYGGIKKEDLIFSQLLALDVNNKKIELGDAFNYSGAFIADGVEQTILTEQQIQSTSISKQTAIEGYADSAAEDQGVAIETVGSDITYSLDYGKDGLDVYVRPYFAYSEVSTTKYIPSIDKSNVQYGTEGNTVYLLTTEGGKTVVWFDGNTGLPTSDTSSGAFGTESQSGTFLLENEEGQSYFEWDGGTVFIDPETGISYGEGELAGELTTIKDSNNKLAIVGTYLYPRAHIYETPYFEEQYVTILDKPPIPPIVNFYPYKDVENSLLITFENQTGDYEDIPVSILPADGQVFQNIRAAQRRQWKDGQGNYAIPALEFKSDDFASEYQVFRIKDNKPSSYEDFSNSLYQIVNVRERTAFVDKLESNVKYYYVFRTIDLHQNLSNPSYLYEVEMVENSGASFPLISVVDFATPPKDLNSRFFNRYLKIEPILAQKIINEQKSGISANGAGIGEKKPVLGIREESIWNQKKFKFRIKSVNTGKAMDLNIKFKTNHKPAGPINSCD